MMGENTSLNLSQGYEVLAPKSGQAYPVPCAEWDVLKNKIAALTTEPWLFNNLGSLLLGAALATAISVWTGAVSPAPSSNAVVISWAIAATCLVSGLACLYFAFKERAVYRSRASDVVTQMQLIEQRFERKEI